MAGVVLDDTEELLIYCGGFDWMNDLHSYACHTYRLEIDGANI